MAYAVSEMNPRRASSLSLPLVGSLLSITLCAACGGGEVQAAARKNVLIVALDTLRPDHLGFYGYDRDTSPALDAFAADFTVFDNAHTVAPWTAPSLISLMTSLYPDAHDVKASPDPGLLSDDVLTLAEALKTVGYRTGAFTEGGYAKPDFGLGQGFDTYPGNPGDETGFTSNRRYPSRLAANVDRCLAWMGEASEEPFLCFFQTYEPHSPYQAPTEIVRRYIPDFDEEADHARLAQAVEMWNQEAEVSDADLRLFQRHLMHCDLRGLPKIDDPRALRDQSRVQGISLFHGEVSSSPGMSEWYTDLYDAEISFADGELARLWSFLEQGGLADDTIVILVSDHGEALGEHGDIGHGRSLFNELTRILFAARVPGLEQVDRSAEPVSLVDVMPTVLDLLGVPSAGLGLHGQSFASLLVGGTGDPQRPLFSHATLKKEHPQHAVRQGDWCLIVDDLSGETELYDLAQDPGETTNVTALHPERTSRMLKLLRSRSGVDKTLAAELNIGRTDTELSDESRAELRALGYIGAD